MRTISWKHPLIALFIGGAMAAACSSDTTSPPPEEAGAKCGNGTVDDGEECDPEKNPQRSCSTATMGAKPMGTVKCDTKKCTEDTSGCKANGGAGGGGGMAGSGTGGTGTGGMGGKAGSAGKGGTTHTDGGPDATPDATPDGSKPTPDSGSGGSAPTDSGKG